MTEQKSFYLRHTAKKFCMQEQPTLCNLLARMMVRCTSYSSTALRSHTKIGGAGIRMSYISTKASPTGRFLKRNRFLNAAPSQLTHHALLALYKCPKIWLGMVCLVLVIDKKNPNENINATILKKLGRFSRDSQQVLLSRMDISRFLSTFVR